MEEYKDLKELISNCSTDIHPSWGNIIKKYISEISDIYKNIYKDGDMDSLTPNIDEIWRAFIINPNDIKVIIIGQDPYPKKGDANGLSFSCNQKEAPASLKNIFACLNRLQYKTESNDLFSWVLQGVFLINMSLTTKIANKRTHSKYWIPLITNIISDLTFMNKNKKMSILLWGNDAQNIEPYLKGKHNILKWTHPSPMSDNKLEKSKQFINCNHFDNLKDIDWVLGKQIIIYTDGGCIIDYKAVYAVYIPDIIKISGLLYDKEYKLLELKNRKQILPVIENEKSIKVTSQRAEYLALSYALWIIYRLKLKNVLIITDSRNAKGITSDWTKEKKKNIKI